MAFCLVVGEIVTVHAPGSGRCLVIIVCANNIRNPALRQIVVGESSNTILVD